VPNAQYGYGHIYAGKIEIDHTARRPERDDRPDAPQDGRHTDIERAIRQVIDDIKQGQR
jgi:hypothetical protein